MEKQTVADRIISIMRHVQFTQKELAEYLGISQPAVSFYLQGRKPPADIIFQISRLGNTTVEWLLTGEESTPSGSFVREPQPIYGNKHALLKLWDQIPRKIQRDVLILLRHIVENQS